MNCITSLDLARHQGVLDRLADIDARIEREAKRLSKLSVHEIIRDAPDDIGQEFDAILGLLAERNVKRDSKWPEPSDADDCRQLMALRQLRRGQ